MSEILRAMFTSPHPYHLLWCPGPDNPSDLVTRGVDMAAVRSDFWQRGAPWFANDVSTWPTKSADIIRDDQKERFLSNMAVVGVVPDPDPDNITERLAERHSSLHKTKRVLSWVVRWLVKTRSGIRTEPSQGSGQIIAKLRTKLATRANSGEQLRLGDALEQEELETAQLLLIQGAQQSDAKELLRCVPRDGARPVSYTHLRAHET